MFPLLRSVSRTSTFVGFGMNEAETLNGSSIQLMKGFDFLGKNGTMKRTEANQYKLFTHKIFLGPMEMNICESVLIVWDNDPNKAGKVVFTVIHGNDRIATELSFHFIDSCFIHDSDDRSARSAIIFSLSHGGARKLRKRLFNDDDLKRFVSNLPYDAAESALMFLVLFLNEKTTGDGEAVFTDLSGKNGSMKELNEIIIQEVSSKRSMDVRVYNKKKGKDGGINVNNQKFCDLISTSNFPEFLKFVGIRTLKQRSEPATYEGTIPNGSADFHLSDALSHASLSSSREDVRSQGLIGKKASIPDGVPPETSVGEMLGIKRKKGASVGPPPQKVVSEENTASPTTSIVPIPSTSEGTKRAQKKKKEPEIMTLDLSDEDESSQEATVPLKKLRKPNELLKYSNVEVSFDDMKGLWHNEMVNDNIVDVYLAILHNHLGVERKTKTHVFSCFFYKRLTDGISPGNAYKSTARSALIRFGMIEKNYRQIAKWTKKVDIFSMDYLVVPVVDDLHWYLVIIVKPYLAVIPPDQNSSEDREKSRLKGAKRRTADTYAVIFDSLVDTSDTKRQCIVDVLRDYLELEFASKKNGSGRVFERTRIAGLRPRGIPQQKNYFDCGFYMLNYAENFLEKPPTKLQVGVKWNDWYADTEVRVHLQRDMVYKRIQKLCSRQAWSEFVEYNEIKKDAREEDRIEEEIVDRARRRRFHSTCQVRRGFKETRRHSEPPSTNQTPAAHFH